MIDDFCHVLDWTGLGLPITMGDLPNTTVDLPSTMVDLSWSYLTVLTVVDGFWPLLTVFDSLWPFLTIFKPFLTVCDHFWPFLTIFDHIALFSGLGWYWPFLTVFDHFLFTVFDPIDRFRPYITHVREDCVLAVCGMFYIVHMAWSMSERKVRLIPRMAMSIMPMATTKMAKFAILAITATILSLWTL